MSGPGTVFFGRIFEALPVTLLVFVAVYATVKTKRGFSNSMPRIVSLFGYTLALTGLAYGSLHDAIATGFGTRPDPTTQDMLEIPAQFVFASITSLLVITAVGHSRQVREQKSGE